MAQWTPSPPGRAFCMLPPRQCLPSQGRSIVESTPFSAWENFYVIIGSSAAALTGLQFVVVVLGAEARSIGPEVGAFGTPTVVHFCAVLLISAILSVPWRVVSNAGLALGAVGVAGIVYMAGVIRRGRRQKSDVPGVGDWVWGRALSLLPDVEPLVGGLVLRRGPPPSPPVVGAPAPPFLFFCVFN